MTPTATRFVGELTFGALTRHPVETDVGGLLPDQRIGHIVIADSADAIVVAPATAHWLAAMATGMAGDAVTATVLASAAPVVVAPAMDGEMYGHPATRANVARLRDDFGYRIVEPDAGPLASGQTGRGRLAETGAIVDAVVAAVDGPARPRARPGRPPAGRRRGPRRRPRRPPRGHHGRRHGRADRPGPVHRQPLDRQDGRRPGPRPRSIAGARVTLIVGHVSVPLPAGGGSRSSTRRPPPRWARPSASGPRRRRRPGHGRRGRRLPAAHGRDHQARPRRRPDARARADRGHPGRRRRRGSRRAAIRRRPILVGFAAETGSLERAADKLRRKGVDLLVANDVAEAGSGLRNRHEPRLDPRRRRRARSTCRSARSARSPTRSSTASRAALDARDGAAQTEPMTQETHA